MGRKAEDLTGKKYGRLTVIKYIGKSKWLCKCECGNEVVIRGDHLRGGDTTSCGCYQKEKASSRMRKMNEEQWKDEEFRQMQSDSVKKLCQDEEYKQMKSDRMRKLNEEQWEDKEFRQMHENIKHNWKGGITPISDYLRKLPVVKQWKKDTYTRENNRCQLTGKHVHGGNSDVHHLYGFNMIVLEAHTINAIEIKQQVKDYTEDELKLLKEYVASWHKDTSNAVLLCDEVHDLFHNCKDKDGNVLYGKGDNTPEQFEEFRERYLNGEFDSKEDVAS